MLTTALRSARFHLQSHAVGPYLIIQVHHLIMEWFLGETSNQGKYTIQAKNKWGELEDSAQLTIVLRPEIEGPEDVKVVPGEATEFTVVVHVSTIQTLFMPVKSRVKSQANPEAQVLWTRDDKVIKASDLISIVEDRANETYKLVFHKVLLADEGYYKVIAKNDLGESSSEARLKTISKF